MHAACRLAQKINVGHGNAFAGDGVGTDHIGAAAGEHGQHPSLFVGRRIGHDGLHHETIHLGFGQVERALLLDRILGGDHHERLGQGDTLPADGRGTLGHGLKHGGLGFGIRTVDLVQQYEIGVNRTDLRGELLRRKIEDLRAHQIRWHEIRSALHALERAGYAGGERLGGRGLGQARHGFDKNMPAGHQGHDKRFA